MSKSNQRDRAIHEQIARVGKAFSSAARLQIILMLSQAPRTVEALAEEIGQTTANTSHHLQKLRETRLVEAERDGVHMIYRLASDDVAYVYRVLRELGEDRLLQLQEFLRELAEDSDELESHDAEELLERARRGEVTVLDVRPAEEFEAGHLPGAVSVPLEQLEEKLGELPADREVVAYCRGPYCALSEEAVETLRRKGFEATRLTEGVPEWKERGLPVERAGNGR